MRNLYIDTEFNSHSGHLISLALASPDKHHWYGIYQIPPEPDPFVAQHVIPQLYAIPPMVDQDMVKFRKSLLDYFAHQPEGTIIYADYPADFRHLLWVLEGARYEDAWWPEHLRMHLLHTPDGEPKPSTPHNALSDAIALRDWHQGLKA